MNERKKDERVPYAKVGKTSTLCRIPLQNTCMYVVSSMHACYSKPTRFLLRVFLKYLYVTQTQNSQNSRVRVLL